MGFDSASKYRMTNAPDLAPGYCWVTRATSGNFVDTGIQIRREDFGHLYLSESAILEMAQGLGLFDKLLNQLAEAKHEGYTNGYREGVKETIGGDLDSIAARIRESAAYLSGILGGDNEPVVEEPLPAEEPERRGDEPVFVTDGADAFIASVVALTFPDQPDRTADAPAGAARRTRRQGAGSGSNDRPVGVPDGSGDEPRIQI